MNILRGAKPAFLPNVRERSAGAWRRNDSRFFWIWLLCLIAYKSNTHPSAICSQHTRLPYDSVQAVDLQFQFIFSIQDSRGTHHVDGWGSSRVVVVGGLLVKSPFTAETEVPIFRVAAFPHSPPRLASPNHFCLCNLPLLTQLYRANVGPRDAANLEV